jgi:iron complex transport system permease protein
VAVAGIVGFVGLIVPHLVRPLTDRRPSVADRARARSPGRCWCWSPTALCRVLPLVTELRLGIALSLVGAPFFLWLLLRMRREAWL